jgi:hypothetical protein
VTAEEAENGPVVTAITRIETVVVKLDRKIQRWETEATRYRQNAVAFVAYKMRERALSNLRLCRAYEKKLATLLRMQDLLIVLKLELSAASVTSDAMKALSDHSETLGDMVHEMDQMDIERVVGNLGDLIDQTHDLGQVLASLDSGADESDEALEAELEALVRNPPDMSTAVQGALRDTAAEAAAAADPDATLFSTFETWLGDMLSSGGDGPASQHEAAVARQDTNDATRARTVLMG